jgi:dienelactone hydrolase
MGAGLAEIIAATRPHTRGAVLMHGAFPLADLQLSRWPSATPAQVHISASDPFVSSDAADAFANDVRAAGANADVFVYDAAGHLFAESGTFDYDADAAAMMRARVLEFLAQL